MSNRTSIAASLPEFTAVQLPHRVWQEVYSFQPKQQLHHCPLTKSLLSLLTDRSTSSTSDNKNMAMVPALTVLTWSMHTTA